MEERDEFLKKMENLNIPDVNPLGHQKIIKFAVLNVSRSATMGVWLIVVPYYFLMCVLMKYYFHVHLGLFDTMVGMMTDLEKSPVMRILSPLLLLILPVTGAVVNTLAIVHVQYQVPVKELIISIKLKWINILLILLSLGIVCLFAGYVFIENIHHY
jgi:hypothetical protein